MEYKILRLASGEFIIGVVTSVDSIITIESPMVIYNDDNEVSLYDWNPYSDDNETYIPTFHVISISNPAQWIVEIIEGNLDQPTESLH